MAEFQVPAALAPAYDGHNLSAQVVEFANPDEAIPTNHIRTTQNWAVDVSWEMRGIQTTFLVDQFHIRVFLEAIGPGAELALPAAGPRMIGTLVPPLSSCGGVACRQYNNATTGNQTRILTPAGTVPAGVYKMVTVVQLHDDAPPGTPYPIVGTVEGPIITFFNPGP
jgi:hypothetical protein